MAYDPANVAEDCIRSGLFFGVNPHFLLIAAQLRSGIKDDADGNRIALYRLTQEEFDALRQDEEFELNYKPQRITSSIAQCDIVGLMAHRRLDPLIKDKDRNPSAVELYLALFPNDGDAQAVAAKMQPVLEPTAQLIRDAADRLFGNSAQSGEGSDAQEAKNIVLNDGNTPIPDGPAPGSITKTAFGSGPFKIKAPRVMKQLLIDFPEFKKLHAAAVLGNIGHESAGFTAFHEKGQPPSQGGIGWCQWTGRKPPDGRRLLFEQFCSQNNLDIMSDEASYAYLKHEMKTKPESRVVVPLSKMADLQQATDFFMTTFERPGVKAPQKRLELAQIALAAFNAGNN
jgi:hypothetical protein